MRPQKKSKHVLSPALKAWNEAVKEAGYMQKGSMKKLPKRGTVAHKKLKAEQQKILKRKCGL